jgi:UDP-galactopyranose mutase
MKYDFLIVGAGLFGSVFAQQCKENNKKVLVIDKRDHIAGNCYTENKNGINIHKYGPHIFHTNNDMIWNYINRFTEFNSFINRPKVFYDNKIYSFPINLFTLNQIWGITNPEQAKYKLKSVAIEADDIDNLESWALSQVGEEIYNIFIRGYTKKQWGKEPRDLPSSIIKRLPIRLDFNDNYFKDQHQGIPIDGYTNMVVNMLDGIDVILNEDYLHRRDYWDSKANQIVYTGPIDKFFEYVNGNLEYRSLLFQSEFLPINDYQGNAIINFTEESVPYTRIIEHKHFDWKDNIKGTVITKEYPLGYNKRSEPYYPVNDTHNQNIYNRYYHLTKESPKYIFGGRLAEYKYYDMHQVIASALSKFTKYGI